MPLAGHVHEARRRALRVAVSLLVGLVVGFVLSDQILDVLRTPVEELARSRQASPNYDTVTGAFDLELKIALFTGVIVSSPVWLRELFAYVTPGCSRPTTGPAPFRADSAWTPRASTRCSRSSPPSSETQIRIGKRRTNCSPGGYRRGEDAAPCETVSVAREGRAGKGRAVDRSVRR